jgi:small subunit ribosomal protein S9
MARKQKVMTRIHAIGRRKSAVARVYLTEGQGIVEVNGKEIQTYFGPTTVYPSVAIRPLSLVGMPKGFDLKVVVKGGGLTGQSDAISLAVARALCMYELKMNPVVEKTADESEDDEVGEEGAVVRPWKATLKSNKMLTRDSRVVERKKYGFRKARKKEQYSKR